MTTQSLDLNLIPKGISPRLYVSQYDKGQTWTFNIYAGNTAYTIPNGATVTIQGTKPDKTGFQYSCTASGNVVTATEQQQMTVIAGEVSAEIRITNNNEIIATLNFILVVEPAALTDETEISETDLPIIEQAIEMFPHYQEMIDDVSSDIATLSNEVDTLSNLVEGATEITTKSFSPVISVIDALPVNAVDVSAKIEPIQAGSGTPSPSNVRAISGRDSVKVTRAGKNLVDFTEQTFTSQARIIDNLFLKAGTYTFSIHIKNNANVAGFLQVRINTTVLVGINILVGDDTRRGNYFTLENDSIINVMCGGQASGYSFTFSDAQIELGSTATAYEPYTGNDYTIQLGDTYYGGTLDVTTGVLTVDRAYDVVTSIVDYSGLYTSSNGVKRAVSGPRSLYAGAHAILCDKYQAYSEQGQISSETLDAIAISSDGRLVITSSLIQSASTAEEATTILHNNGDIALVYELASPFTVQLTPQEIQMLQGNNTIFTDSGDTSIQYYANGVKNLEASVSAIQNDTNDLKALTAIFGTFENGTTASKPYAQGDYFVKNNKMCKAKTSIAKGATFTLNTNYEEKTLAEILKTIETA